MRPLRYDVWTDKKICLAQWYEYPNRVSFIPSISFAPFDQFGFLLLNSIPIFINKWVELKISGRRAWLVKVSEKVLKQRKEEADARAR